jgi:hypothetical protein
MLKPITLLPYAVVIMSLFQTFFPPKQESISIAQSKAEVMPPILSCKTQVTFFYDVNRKGVSIHASELYNSVSGSGLQFFIKDTIRSSSGAFLRVDRYVDSIDIGLNSIFTYRDSCTIRPRNLVLTVVDNANDSVSCTVSIITLDTLAPEIICPVLLVGTTPQCDTTAFGPRLNSATAFVNAGGMVKDSSFEINPINFNDRVKYDTTTIARSGCNLIHTRIYRVTDYFCNTSTCKQDLVVRDTAGLICPSDTVVFANTACLGSFIPDISNLTTSCMIGSRFHNGPTNNTYPFGSTTINVTAVTTCSDTLRCSYKVIVRDTLPPTIICPSNDTVFTCTPVSSPALTTLAAFRADGGSVRDNCDSTNNITLSSTVGATTSLLCNKQMIRTYTVTDVNGRTSTCNQTIISRDTTKPSVTVPATLILNANSNCQADTMLARPIATDNCTLPNQLTYTRIPSSNIFSKGTTLITWTVSDSCGNSRQVTQNVVVMDKSGPNLMCRGLRVRSLGASLDSIPADFFVDLPNTSDPCGGPLTYKVRRTVASCGKGTTFGTHAFICCNDVQDTIMVEVEARDTSNNVSTCMTRVEIQEKTPPQVGSELPDINVSCDYIINLTNLSAFGTYVGKEADRKNLTINDTLAKLQGLLRDGLVNEVCLQSIVELTPKDNRTKGAGDIIRSFKVTDAGGFMDTFTQKITVRDLDTLKLSDITWPAHYTYTNCKLMPPPADTTGKPIIRVDDICTTTATSFSDQIFDNPLSGCKYIRRTWKVIDWATYVPNTNRGLYKYVQEITLVNNVKPVFTANTCSPKIVCAPNSDCDGRLNIGADAFDDCSLPTDLRYAYSIDINNDGTYDLNGSGDTISVALLHGNHTVVWKVTDGCGNIETCNVPVRMKECKAPTAICHDGLKTNLGENTSLSIWAKDFNIHSSDNCTPADQLVISFSPDSLVMNRTFTCANRPSVSLFVYFTDKDGNTSRCLTRLEIQDSRNICPSLNGEGLVAKHIIAGKISTEEDFVLEQTKVLLQNDVDSKELMTDKEGLFSFEQLVEKKNYSIKPERKTDWAEGLNTLDLVMIQRHILGLKKLDSPYKMIAADIDNNEKISSGDLVLLRKLILGTVTDVPSNDSWRFVNKSYQFPDNSNPWGFDNQASYVSLETSMPHTDFVGIKIGDVSGTVSGKVKNLSADTRSNNTYQLNVADVTLNKDQASQINLVPNADNKLQAMQLEFVLDPRKVILEGIKSDILTLSEQDYNYDPATGRVRIVSLPQHTADLSSAENLLTLQVRPLADATVAEVLKLSSSKENNFINENDENISVELFYTAAEKILSVDQNQPNPFSNYTDIKFQLSIASEVQTTIVNSMGLKVFVSKMEYNAGQNNLRISKEDLGGTTGIFYVYISTGEERAVKKIMRFN